MVPGRRRCSTSWYGAKAVHGTRTKKIKMPPGKPLSDAVVNDLAIWVRDGTSWPKGAATEERDTHWAFEPVRVVEPPPDPSATSLVL
jgi:hypothetical protein